MARIKVRIKDIRVTNEAVNLDEERRILQGTVLFAVTVDNENGTIDITMNFERANGFNAAVQQAFDKLGALVEGLREAVQVARGEYGRTGGT